MGRKWDSNDSGKGGGSKYKADIKDDQGPLTCGTCGGSGEVFRTHTANYAGDASKEDQDSKKCSTCGGKGTVG